MTRVVVGGAGMSGLATAALLAVRGHQVTVVEASATYGGKVAQVEQGDFRFDVGPSLVTLPAVYREIFGRTGRPLDEVLELIALDPAFRYQFADGTVLEVPGADPAACANAMGDVFGGNAGADWIALMQRAAEVWSIVREPILENPLRGISDLLPLLRQRGAISTVAPWSTLRDVGKRYLTDPRARQILDRYATYTGSDPRRTPAALLTIPYVEQAFGAWHIAGGIRALATAMFERCVERGVQFAFDNPIESISMTASSIDAVRTSAGVIPADVFVSALDARQLYGSLVPPPLGRSELRRLNRATASLSGFSLLLALRGTTANVLHHNVLFPADYNAEFDAVFSGRQVADPTIYICAPDDDAMRPVDGESWFVLVNAPCHGTGRNQLDWTAPGVADAYAEHVVDTMTRRGLDVRDRILWSAARTPADLERETSSPGGAIYGTSSNGVTAAFRRPANAGPVPGLFLVGGTAHPGGGLPLVGMSALTTADLIGRA